MGEIPIIHTYLYNKIVLSFFNIIIQVLKFWKFYHFENFEILWNFWFFFFFWKILKFDIFLYIATSTRLLRILTESNSTSNSNHWFPVASFPVQGILSISAMDLESKYCYFYHSLDFVPYNQFVLEQHA